MKCLAIELTVQHVTEEGEPLETMTLTVNREIPDEELAADHIKSLADEIVRRALFPNARKTN